MLPTKNVRYGKMITCMRCDRYVFLEQTSESELDGGYTIAHEYEPIPQEWEHIDVEKDYSGWYCPACSKEFHKRLSGFMPDI